MMMCLEALKSWAAGIFVVASVVLVGASSCSSPAGETCSTNADCQSGYECTSTGGVVFGDRICLLSEEAAADAAVDVTDASGSDVALDAAPDVAGDADVRPDVAVDSGHDADGDDVVVDPCADFEPSACASRAHANATGCFEGDCTYECADGYFDQNGDLADAGGDGCESAECTPTNGGQEACDGIDNDCDGEIDEGVKTTFYKDADRDLYGGSTTAQACTAPSDYVEVDGDCDDTDSDVHPGADETCDGDDNDCDGDIDEDVETTFYRDGDGDGFGLTGDTQQSCSPNGAYSVTRGGDCDDTNASINPNAAETCDGVDNDCDQQTDEGVQTTYYLDEDNDGYGTGANQRRCSASGAYRATQSGDCDDTDASVHPGANEVCDGTDNDCDGSTDEGVRTTYYHDGDDDGYGVTNDTQSSCSPSGDYTATQGGDCEDTQADAYPGATEQCSPFIDYDCDGDLSCADADCNGSSCFSPNGPGTCTGGTCASDGGCNTSRDCGIGEDCQYCSGGPNVCCPQGQLCPCFQ